MPDNQTMPRMRGRTDRGRDDRDRRADPDAAFDDRYPDDDLDDRDLDEGEDSPASAGRSRRAGRRPVRGTRMLIGIIATVILLIAAGLVAYFTPLMSVRSVEVSGTSVVSRDDIVAAARIATGTPLLQVDTRPAAQRIAAIPRIKTVRVARGYPSSIDITVVERTAVAFEDRSGTAHLYDVDGVDFAQQPKAPALPRLTSGTDVSDAARRAALEVVAGLPDFLSRQVVSVAASSPSDVRLTLRDRKTVVWGDADRGADKARTLRFVLPRADDEVNVSAPEYPTFR
ncbi:FtsQ-type POTRA domain-containing protein [Williamsia sp.]|uniref:cell division protein FtsQ/DivIB n=1 Tax=Williamsia sp. TaxID=1872085 RepID=UPI001A3023A9|nr:FtsQ-type POTRA domain-containing protein [Williamsia sp.]MBJ7288945.1 FtsQ-type POTRA domain-containing protein [Williamsia sp.]